MNSLTIQGASQGFLLIESMIALVIMLIFITIVAYYQCAIIGQQHDARKRLQASVHVHTVLEKIINYQESSSGSCVCKDGITITWRQQAIPDMVHHTLPNDGTGVVPIPCTIVRVQAVWRCQSGEHATHTVCSALVDRGVVHG